MKEDKIMFYLGEVLGTIENIMDLHPSMLEYGDVLKPLKKAYTAIDEYITAVEEEGEEE